MFRLSQFRLDLKLRLTLRVAAIAAICFAVAAVWALIESDRALWSGAARIADIVARGLALQLEQEQWVSVGPRRFPDLQSIAGLMEAPGYCIAFRAPGGAPGQRMCMGAPPETAAVPYGFAAIGRRLVDRGREIVRPVAFRGETLGEAAVSIDIDSRIAHAWFEARRILPAMAVAMSALCVLVYAAMARALSPTGVILHGLRRLAADDLAARLPPFDLAELSEIREVFNALAQKLERAIAARARLTRMLIEVQDEERRRLARELHDEFGQYLAAISAMAASAGQTASRDFPALAPECQSIARSAAHMMEALKGALVRLRPPDVEELGLVASLESLVASWNGMSRGATRFDLDVRGEFDDLPPAVGVNLYRIAQEAITNAVKHARASRVGLRLRRNDAENVLSPGRRSEVELTVEDDGHSEAGHPSPKPGLGLLGIEERIAALGGRLEIERGQASGLVLHARLPVT